MFQVKQGVMTKNKNKKSRTEMFGIFYYRCIVPTFSLIPYWLYLYTS